MDREAIRSFTRQFGMISMHTALMGVVSVCDRVGLFEQLGEAGPTKAGALAERAGLQPRYVEEALAALASGGLVQYDAAEETFELTEAAAVCLTDSDSPYYVGGWAQGIPAIMSGVARVAEAMRRGGGVDIALYGDDLVEATDRMNGPALTVLLARKWLLTMPDVVERLEGGIRVADLGCGSGAAAIAVGRAFPASEVHGFDIDERALGRARKRAADAGVANVEFEQMAIEDIPSGYDFAMSFDVIHDLGDPLAALRAIRAALTLKGTYLMVEPNAGPTLADNQNPIGATLYSMSLLHCLPVSLAKGDVGLGTAWGPERARSLATEAGFGRFERLPIENPMNAFYRLGP